MNLGRVRSAQAACRDLAQVAGNLAQAASQAAWAAAGQAGQAAGEAVRAAGERAADAAQTLADAGPGRDRRHVWSHRGHAAIEVRGLECPPGGGADQDKRRRMASAVRQTVSGLRGVRWAEVNAVTSQLLVGFDERRISSEELVRTVQEVEEAHGAAADTFSWSMPVHPSDDAPLTVTWTALAGDLVGVGVGVGARIAAPVARVVPTHAAIRLPLAIIDGYPRLRGLLEKQIGPIATDLVLGIGNAAIYGVTEGPDKPAVDAVYRLLVISELRARRAAWAEHGAELTDMAASCAAAAPSHEGRPAPFPAGPIESYTDRVAAGSLAAAAAVLVATRDLSRGAEALNASVPKAAKLGREGFAAVLGRDLARGGVVPMDRSSFRRLDRISVVVIESEVLTSDRPRVLSATAADPESAHDGVWRAASRVLAELRSGDLRGPGPWRAGGHQLARVPGDQPAAGPAAAPDGPDGMRLRVLADQEEEEEELGEVVVGCELDPLAEAVLAAARAGAGGSSLLGSGAAGDRIRLLLTSHASLDDLVARADEVMAGDVAAKVRALQAEGEGVLLVAARNGAALHAADVAVGCIRASGCADVCWAADLICPTLADVWRLLTAIGAARSVSERSVILAAGGATLGLLLAAVGRTGRGSGGQGQHGAPAPPVSPVQAASLASLAQGAYSARRLSLVTPPVAVPRVAWHAMTAEEVLSRLARARAEDTGAAQAERAPGGGGPEQLLRQLRGQVPEPVARGLGLGADLVGAVAAELKDPLTPVLLLGSAASALLGSAVDAALVGGVMIGNAVVGGAQRMRTERALQALLVREQQSARRVRDAGGAVPEDPERAEADLVPASELRPGDLIALRGNDVVPADARLLAADALEVDESTLTGESLPVGKAPAPAVGAPLAERTSMVYEGTTVVSGSAVAVVVATGDATEAGRAGTALSGVGTPAPAAGVSAHLSELTSKALPVTGAGGFAVTALGMLRGVPLRQALEAGVAVAVAAVPEGLPLVATVAQLAAARRLSRRGVLVRSPRTLEALGRVDVVCFDKTGTLTEGRLQLAATAIVSDDVEPDSEQGQHLLRAAARACPPPTGGHVAHATDKAILDSAADLSDSWELVEETPFQSARGFSASLGRCADGLLLAVKGAPEVVLGACTSVAGAPGGPGGQDPAPLTEERRQAARATIDRLAADGLRVLAVAQREVREPPGHGAEPADLAQDLTLLGFVAIADVMRADAATVLKELSEAGVRTVMITGDHPATASAIARGAGMPGADDVVTGAELDRLPERERRERVNGCSVFARVSPEQKVRIVTDLRRAGRVVAMVGDGSNDAAAIRLADVGIGVRAKGSTAARTASDLVLVEGDIARIRDALHEGRALWRSVRDAVSILVGGNAGEIAFMVIGTALGGRSPLNTRQLLLVNMLTDMFPALAVAGTRSSAGNGTEPVGSLLEGPLARQIMLRGGATALGGTLAWGGGRLTGRPARAATMGLAAVVTTQLAQTLITGARSPAVIVTCVGSAAALVGVVNTPGVSQFFGCTPLGPAAWVIVVASAATATAAGLAAPRVIPALASSAGGGSARPAPRQGEFPQAEGGN
ncbi:MAG: cation-translocating P-type ATPase [Streptosporangiaceae bacterium]|nr:cation-translocating P-type ATPase [Streptosporangiaceae bacterium]